MIDVVAFDVWSDYAHFKKFFTTTSPLTFSVPPRTSLMGLIGAICGLGKDEYMEVLASDRANLAVSIINPIKKMRLAENLIDTEKGVLMGRIKTRTQIRFEFVKDARYRVYVNLSDDERHATLQAMLEAHQSVYTPCLGISEHIANFNYVGSCRADIVSPGDHVDVISAINDDLIDDLMIEPDKEYFSEVMPCDLNAERVPQRYAKIIYEKSGKPMRARIKAGLEIAPGAFIAFL